MMAVSRPSCCAQPCKPGKTFISSMTFKYLCQGASCKYPSDACGAHQQQPADNTGHVQEQHQAQARHEAEVSELWRKVDEGTERLAAVKRDMQLARQDMDNAREDMQHAQTDLDAYIARRPDSAIDRRW